MTRLWGMVGVVLALALGACGNETQAEARGEIVVSAAASLTDAFTEIEVSFEEAHPEADVVLNFAGSPTLREQILEGAPVDVFASADTRNMDEVVAANVIYAEPSIFAINRMQIAVPSGNPGGVTGLQDFAEDSLIIGLCSAEVPCGAFARQVFDAAGVDVELDTNESDVRALITKIEAGEIDAGITYVTDVIAAGAAVDGIDIPEAENITAEFPIVILAEAPNLEGATRFTQFILSLEGQEILGQHGFGLP